MESKTRKKPLSDGRPTAAFWCSFFDPISVYDKRKRSDVRIIALAVRYNGRGDDLGSREGMRFLIVEENVRAECGKNLFLAYAAEEERLIDADVPVAQRPDRALMRRRRAAN